MSAADPLAQFVHYGSEAVAAAIVAAAPGLSDDDLRTVLLAEWPRCEAHRPHRAALVQLYQQVGFVADGPLPARLAGRTCTVYRGNLGEPEPVGISWTLSRRQAEFFASYPMTLRGRFLGTYDPTGIPTVWRGTVACAAVLAYYGARDEQEVVLDPATVRGVHPVSSVDPVALAARLAAA